MAKIVELIYTEAPRGKGTPNDPARTIKQLWSKGGRLLAEQDTWASRSVCDFSELGSTLPVPSTTT